MPGEADAFTRPKRMCWLAKAGFSQSYTYFTWRTTKPELEAYLRELVRAPVADFFRPCFWPTTPDIFPEHLAHGGRAAFVERFCDRPYYFVRAATPQVLLDAVDAVL